MSIKVKITLSFDPLGRFWWKPKTKTNASDFQPFIKRL